MTTNISGKMKNKIVAFIMGDITVTLCQILSNFWHDLGLFAIKIIATLILGIAGGVAGLIGKDYVYPWIKKIVKYFLTKIKKKNNANKVS